jgi:hypothetical protein
MKKAAWFAGLGVILGGSILLGQPSTRNPHGPLKHDCEDCHTAERWSALRSPLAFEHAETGFPLAGAHGQAKCSGCHKDPIFSRVGTACADCHADHHEGQLGPDCQNCHTPRNWQNQKDVLELHVQRGFALTGVHAAADCEACHRGEARDDYAGTPVDCQGCHAEAFAATTNPNHMQAGFSADCELCHNAARGMWSEVRYAHASSFALTGAHKNVECNVCHTSVYAGTPGACYDCHSAEFAATTEPPHATSGFGHDCTICHSTSGWTPSRFDHNATAFPLTGRHATLTCVSCHESGYAGTPSACYACHQTAYNATTDPNHAAAGFPTDCQACHSTVSWSATTWDHDGLYFPIYSGAHNNRWDACADCHVNPASFATFECITCHQQPDTDAKHSSVSDYQYLSSACYTCHPRGTH